MQNWFAAVEFGQKEDDDEVEKADLDETHLHMRPEHEAQHVRQGYSNSYSLCCFGEQARTEAAQHVHDEYSWLHSLQLVKLSDNLFVCCCWWDDTPVRRSTCSSCPDDVSFGVPVVEKQPRVVKIMCSVEIRERH